MKQLAETAAKYVLVVFLFAISFAVAVLICALINRVFPDTHFIVYALPLFGVMWCSNRFILSPLQFKLNIRSLQYDPWYENRFRKEKNAV